jgi:antitoxin component YwqK of YwqJK toxin-antitoxin module
MHSMFTRALALIAVVAAAGCATPRTTCALGTELRRQVFSGGAEAEWCVRPDGARQGSETRFYESGAELASGAYVDGAQSGVWRYRFNDGRNWRAERWEDGALLQTTVDPAVARMSPAEMEALGPTTSGIIKLASHDPIPGREIREAPGPGFVSRFPNGRPHVAGSYDRDGLRVGDWRTWFEDGKPALELGYLGGVRDGDAREWHATGAPAAEGRYVAGAREGNWRFWNDRGQLTGETFYRNGAPLTPGAGGPAPGGMLPAKP